MEGFDDFASAVDGQQQQLNSGDYQQGPTNGFGDAFMAADGQGLNDGVGDGFMAAEAQGYEAPAVEEAAAPQAPVSSEPPPTDARIAWRAQNATNLAKKDADEQVAKKEVEATAQAYLKDFYEKRDARVAHAKKENREVQEAAKLKPTGDTAWERVMSLIDFKFDSGRQKEVERERFKHLLFTAKEKKVPVHPPYAASA